MSREFMKVVVTDYVFANLDPETAALAGVADVLPFRTFPGPDALLEAARDADGLIINQAPITASVIDRLEKCKVMVRYGVGIDTIDLAAATRKGIMVVNVPGYCTADVADHAMTLALGLVRKLPRAIDYLRSGGWSQEPLRPIRRLSSLTLGLYGFGRIGRAVAQRAKGFGFRLIGCDPYVSDEVFASHGVDRVMEDALLAGSDVLSLHMPANDETRNIVNEDRLSKMKKGMLLVNTARGGLIDTPALLKALESGHVGGAALDVLDVEPMPADHPLWKHENVFLTPHLAWYSEESLLQLQRDAGMECARALRGEPVGSVVNPEYLKHR
jgi:D-3-phosphoglycerate dehydrogenase